MTVAARAKNSLARPELPLLRQFIAGINLLGLLLLWFVAIIATVILTVANAPSLVIGLAFGGLGALAFLVIPSWPRLLLLSATRFRSADGRAVGAFMAYQARHSADLRSMGDYSVEIASYLEEHADDFDDYVRKSRQRASRTRGRGRRVAGRKSRPTSRD